MSATEVLASLKAAGHTIRLSGDELVIRPRPAAELLDQVREHKAELVELLADPWRDSLFNDVMNDDEFWRALPVLKPTIRVCPPDAASSETAFAAASPAPVPSKPDPWQLVLDMGRKPGGH